MSRRSFPVHAALEKALAVGEGHPFVEGCKLRSKNLPRLATPKLRSASERVFSVLPVLAPVSTEEIVYRVAERFNDRGAPTEDLEAQIRRAVGSALRRLRKAGLAVRSMSGSVAVWRRA